MAQIQKTCILILGMHRSGTSALTRIINLCGATLPSTLLSAVGGNTTGHWESQKIVNFHDEFLSNLNTSWNDWADIDMTTMSKSITQNYMDDFTALLKSEYGSADTTVLKDPRICRFLPLTLNVLKAANIQPKVIHILRNPIEVSRSLYARDNMPEEISNLLWLRHNLDAERYGRQVPYKLVNYHNLLEDWNACLQGVNEKLDIFNPSILTDIAPRVTKFLSPEHRHHVHSVEETLIDHALRHWVGETYETLLQTENNEATLEQKSKLDKIHKELIAATPFLSKTMRTLQTQYEKLQGFETSTQTLHTETQALKNELSLSETEINNLNIDRNEINKKIDQMNIELQTQITKSLTQIASAKTKETELLEGLTWERTQKDQVANKLMAHNAELTKLQQELDAKTNEIKIIKAKNIEDSEEFISLTNKLQKTKEDHAQLQKNSTLKDEENSTLRAKETELLEGLTWERTQKKQAANKLMTHSAELAKLQQELDAKTTEVEAIRIKNIETDMDLITTANELQKTKDEYTQLQNRSALKDEENSTLKALEAKLLQNLQLERAHKDETFKELTNHKRKVSRLKKQLDTKKDEVKAAAQKSVQDNDALKNANDKLTQAEGEVSQLQGTMNLRAKDYEALKTEIETVEKLHQDTLKSKTELSRKNKALASSEVNLSTQNDALLNKLQSQEKNLRAHKESLESLNLQLSRQATALAFQQNQIAAIHASNSWKITSPIRVLKNLRGKKTRFLMTLLAGGSARALLKNSDNVHLAAEQSRSPETLKARINLQNDRDQTITAPWLRTYVNRGQDILDSDLPHITISAVLYNSEKWLWNFFMSIESLRYPMEKISIHFIDNASTDNSVQAVQTFIDKNTYRYNDLKVTKRPNLGYGVGNNFAIREAKTEFVLVTNVDIEFYTDCLRNLVSVAMQDDTDVACWETRQTPHEHPKYYDPVTLQTNWSAHAAVLLRRSAYVDVGGYDSKIFMYGEDVELSYRFRAKGWKLRYIPTAVIYHHVELGNAEVRPHQLSGSSAANILIRYRYGSYSDIIAGEAFLQAVKRNESDPLRAQAWEQVDGILKKNRWHFFKKRMKSERVSFPFNEFDYDVARPGAAVIREPYKPEEAKKLPLITIITRTHGPAELHLRNVISNVLMQTYPNIEHIIVEDSTDFGKTYVDQMSETFGDRIRYLKSPGKGRSECGNYGASKARGEYLCWLDNDDLLFADHLETLFRGFEDNEDAICSYALAWDAYVNEKDGEPYAEKFELPPSHVQPYDEERFVTDNFIPIQAIIFRKSAFDRFGGFNPEFSQLEDWNLWARYSVAGPFIYTPKVTSIYFTPSNPDKRQERHMQLHAAYSTVQAANISDMALISNQISEDKRP